MHESIEVFSPVRRQLQSSLSEPCVQGTPPKPFTLIVDTGSTIMYVPCADCPRGNCGTNHLNPPYDPSASNTFSKIACGTNSCYSMCGSRNCCAKVTDVCTYERRYAEGSAVQGNVISDVMWLAGYDDPAPVVFGCEEMESGALFSTDKQPSYKQCCVFIFMFCWRLGFGRSMLC